MESFSLLKYWRGGGGAALAATATPASNSGNTTITTTGHPPQAETDDDGNGDDGPFFDLEFTMPSEDGQGEEEDTGSSDEEEERELDLVVSAEGGCSGDALQSESCLSLSPSSSDDLFFKGRLVPLEPTSLVLSSSGPDSKPQLAATLLKSATKFRVFLLGFKKPKPMAVDQNDAIPASPKQQQQQQGKFFIKFKIEEVPFVSLFTRDNSSRNPGSSGRVAKLNAEDALAAAAGSEEKKFTKEVVQRYLNKIKPLYIRVSRKYAEKMRFSGLLNPAEVAGKDEKEADGGEDVAAPPAIANGAESQKSQVRSLPAGLRVVRKRLGKSKSASSAIVVAPSLPVPAQRRDDTLLQQQDGIQSAIAHCKQSFNAAAKGSESPLVRSMSDPVRSMSVPGEDGCQRAKGECI